MCVASLRQARSAIQASRVCRCCADASAVTLQMSFAICLQVLNHLHFKRPELILAEFLPQILFMESIFGYLVVCILYKWSVDWEAAERQPPNLLNMLIKMFLSPGNVRSQPIPRFPLSSR